MNNFIWSKIALTSVELHWIGLHDTNNEGIFHWLDEKEKATYLNWGTNQPNNIVKTNSGQDCVDISNKYGYGKWNDNRCDRESKFICEKNFPGFTADLCPSGWTISPSSGTCIKVYLQKKSWEDARAACKADGADLVKIVDDNMNNFIWSKIALTSAELHWIGLHDKNNEGIFHWLDEEEKATYLNWGTNQPNNIVKTNSGQDCVDISNKYGYGKWNDNRCDRESKFICEKNFAGFTTGTTAGAVSTKSVTLDGTPTPKISEKDSCPFGWIFSPHSGTCIKTFSEMKTWEDARATCIANGADLVKIVDDNMNKFIWDQVSLATDKLHWIGLHDQNGNGTFHWLDEKEKTTYLNWGFGQPNNLGSGNQDCVDISGYHGDGKWNDRGCDRKLRFICEKNLQGSTTETTVIAFTNDIKTEVTTTAEPENLDSCPVGWIFSPHSGTCIKIFSEMKTWGDARATCLANGADLVKIVDDNMNKFIWDQVSLASYKLHWIGLHDQNNEGSFHWLDEREKTTYLNWGYGQPNNVGVVGQDCVDISDYFGDGKWNDRECTAKQRFICEKNLQRSATETTVIASTKDIKTVVTTTAEPENLDLCPSGWTYSPHSGTCIKVYPQRETWEDARAACKADGADLVKIVDNGMNKFIWDQASASGSIEHWIGLHDLNNEGTFHWLDEKEKATFLNWGTNQPNDLESGQDCVEISANYGVGKWNDYDCSLSFSFICEKGLQESTVAGDVSTKSVISDGTPTPTVLDSETTADDSTVLTTIPQPSNSDLCPSGWTFSPHSGTCIKVYLQRETWEDARAACKADGADLVKIVDNGMNTFIWDQASTSGSIGYWIGLHDLNNEGTFHWLDEKEKATFLNWATYQPSDLGRFQDCVEISGVGKWNDNNCKTSFPFICEKFVQESTFEWDVSTNSVISDGTSTSTMMDTGDQSTKPEQKDTTSAPPTTNRPTTVKIDIPTMPPVTTKMPTTVEIDTSSAPPTTNKITTPVQIDTSTAPLVTTNKPTTVKIDIPTTPLVTTNKPTTPTVPPTTRDHPTIEVKGDASTTPLTTRLPTTSVITDTPTTTLTTRKMHTTSVIIEASTTTLPHNTGKSDDAKSTGSSESVSVTPRVSNQDYVDGKQSAGGMSVVVIVGIAAGACVVCIVIVAVFVFRRRSHRYVKNQATERRKVTDAIQFNNLIYGNTLSQETATEGLQHHFNSSQA
ncbi:hypothetical protein EGW08_013528 [Elysia chlorotica]|uniref:C-type lectin domain-containing protein n=1 Tax=Elysia chlorotica TaxID=188477 RepID=A0A3S1BA24_ELYCH|nr:hypothetical protein EGW08_013528 [Elysia chlorotica]